MSQPSGTDEGADGGPQHLFVYGTLRRGIDSRMGHWLQRHAIYRGPGQVLGRLYEVNGYPGLVESNRRRDRVIGDLYRLPDVNDMLAALDVYEECSERFPEPREYCRTLLPVLAKRCREQLAWVYVYNRPVHRLRRIESGDYLPYWRRAAATGPDWGR